MSINPNQPEQSSEVASNDKEYNFAQIRKQLEQERQAKNEMEQKTILMARQLEELQSRSQIEEPDSNDEPYVDHKALEKKLSKWEQKIDQKIDKRAEEKARALVNAEKKTQYLKTNNDFNDVLNMENIQKFAEKYPQLAEGILGMPDDFERQKLVYENIKALNVHKKEEIKNPIQEVVNNNRKNLYYTPSGSAAPAYAGQGDFSPAGQKNAYDKLLELKSRLRI